jgi:diguanylate cyclase (GGDEF)-like protein
MRPVWRTGLPIGLLVAALSLSPGHTYAASSLTADIDALEHNDVSADAFRKLLARIDTEGTPVLKARAYVLQCQRNIGADPEAMRSVADAGIAVARAAGANAELGGLLLCRGYIEERADKVARALADYSAAIEISEKAGALGDAAQARVLRGELEHQYGRYAEGLRDMQVAYRYYGDAGNRVQQSYALNAIANFYADPRVGQYDKALKYYRQVFAGHRATGNRAEMATARYNIASTLERKGEYREALTEFRATIAGYEAAGDTTMVADTRRAIAAMLLRMGRPAEALPMAERALEQAQDSDDANLIARTRLIRGSALLKAGRADDALTDLDAARAYFEAEDNPRFLEHIAGERAEAFSALRRWQDAFAARSRQFELSRELDKQLEQDVTARMRVQFDSERTEHENAALLRENNLRNQALVDAQRIRRLQAAVIALGGAVLVGVLWLAWRFRRRARTMHALALTDELTGAPNRRAILDLLGARLDARDAAPLGLMIFDIDHFKTINDQRGHDVGDAVLRKVVDVARATLAGDGTLGRIGGEEFLVVLSGGDENSASIVGERLRAAIEALVVDDRDIRLPVSISLGGTIAKPGVDRVEDALKRADLALYRAKEAGRNRMDWQP